MQEAKPLSSFNACPSTPVGNSHTLGGQRAERGTAESWSHPVSLAPRMPPSSTVPSASSGCGLGAGGGEGKCQAHVISGGLVACSHSSQCR